MRLARRLSRGLAPLALAATLAAGVAPRPAEHASRGMKSQVGVTASLAPDSVSGTSGQRKTLLLRADMGTTGKLLASYAVGITWDSTVVRLDSVGAGDFGAPVVNYVSGAQVRLSGVNTNGFPAAFSLAKLYFRFVNDTAGKRTVVQPTFTDLNATDFTALLTQLTVTAGVARVLAAPTLVHFTPDSLLQRVGYKPQVDFTADIGDPDVLLGSFTADVSWDSTVMVLDSAAAGALPAPQVNRLNAGSVRITSADAKGAGGVVKAAKLFFRFVSASYPVVATVGVTVGEMHAAASFANMLPGVTVKAGKAVVGGWLRGDFDVNDAVAALDAQLILQAVVGLTTGGVPQGDADCNAALSAKDAQIVLNYVVGNPTPFCVGKIQ